MLDSTCRELVDVSQERMRLRPRRHVTASESACGELAHTRVAGLERGGECGMRFRALQPGQRPECGAANFRSVVTEQPRERGSGGIILDPAERPRRTRALRQTRPAAAGSGPLPSSSDRPDRAPAGEPATRPPPAPGAGNFTAPRAANLPLAPSGARRWQLHRAPMSAKPTAANPPLAPSAARRWQLHRATMSAKPTQEKGEN